MTLSLPIARCAVIGNPVAHSRSPFIHEDFARQTGLSLRYDKLEAPINGFTLAVKQFFDQGGIGLNVTVPFKQQAFDLAADALSTRARIAGAVNTLWMEQGRLHGCNTDGIGLLNDIIRLGYAPDNKNILVVGAGGAARGILEPLLRAGCSTLRLVNRTEQRALSLRDHLALHAPDLAARLQVGGLDQACGHWDIVINATSTGLTDQAPDLPENLYADGALAYDMVYGAQATAFMKQAADDGAATTADGLGMLVAQAAASFVIWHDRTPDIDATLESLRRALYT
jgi:shikimate dehydrogenase